MFTLNLDENSPYGISFSVNHDSQFYIPNPNNDRGIALNIGLSNLVENKSEWQMLIWGDVKESASPNIKKTEETSIWFPYTSNEIYVSLDSAFKTKKEVFIRLMNENKEESSAVSFYVTNEGRVGKRFEFIMPKARIMGDVDGDGIISETDLRLARDYIGQNVEEPESFVVSIVVGNDEETGEPIRQNETHYDYTNVYKKRTIDFDGDGVVSEEDVEQIYNILQTRWNKDDLIHGRYYRSLGTNNNRVNENLLEGSHRFPKTKYTFGTYGELTETKYNTCKVYSYSGTSTGTRELMSYNVPVKSAEVYTFSFWAKGSGRLGIRFHDGVTCAKSVTNQGVVSVNTNTNYIDLTSSWERYEVCFTMPVTSSTGLLTPKKIQLIHYNGHCADLSVNFCGWKLERGDTATRYCPHKNDKIGLETYIPFQKNLSDYGTGRDVTYYGNYTGYTSPKYVQANYGWALESNYTASTDKNVYVSFANPLSKDTTCFSISLWVKFNSFNPEWNALASASNGSYGLGLYVNGNGSTIRLNDDVSADATACNITTGQWYHICAVRTPHDKKIYLNGALKSTVTSVGNIEKAGNTMYLFREPSGSYATNCQISDFRIYCTDLNQTQINSIYKPTISTDVYTSLSQKDTSGVWSHVGNDNVYSFKFANRKHSGNVTNLDGTKILYLTSALCDDTGTIEFKMSQMPRHDEKYYFDYYDGGNGDLIWKSTASFTGTNTVDSFIEHYDIGYADIPKITRFTDLYNKEEKSSDELVEFNQLMSEFRNKLTFASDFNKMNDALVNMQLYYKNYENTLIDYKIKDYVKEIENMVNEVDLTVNKKNTSQTGFDAKVNQISRQMYDLHGKDFFDFDDMTYMNGFVYSCVVNADGAWVETIKNSTGEIIATRTTTKNSSTNEYTIVMVHGNETVTQKIHNENGNWITVVS